MKCSDPQPNAAAVRAAAIIGIVGGPRTQRGDARNASRSNTA